MVGTVQNLTVKPRKQRQHQCPNIHMTTHFHGTSIKYGGVKLV